MRLPFAFAILCASIGSAALADGPQDVIDHATAASPYAPLPGNVYDWSGPYLGGLAVYGGGNMRYASPDAQFRIEDDAGFGGFAGYNWQRGQAVFGGELSVLDFNAVPPASPGEDFGMLIDLKARAGVAAGRTLVYGFLGYSFGGYERPAPFGNWDVEGPTYGLGADVAVSDNAFVGIEYSRRELDGLVGNGGGQTQAIDLDLLQLRFGWRF
ncbi:outer membrane beta-barrel protein [Aliiroseovarius sp.]|uniref:outer membrane protein n=1 Tax=Aliiroseovarius sp. TaxID=1872442 RepID=UPI0026318E11|nr:outer membrane beta-barrel protein [Aliiroseovarius sp.]